MPTRFVIHEVPNHVYILESHHGSSTESQWRRIFCLISTIAIIWTLKSSIYAVDIRIGSVYKQLSSYRRIY